MPESDFVSTLRALGAGGVDFILVGGLSASLQGALVPGYDFEIVHSCEASNVERLLRVLESLDAVFRVQPHLRIKPALSHLAGTGHLSLITRHGPLDVLGTIGRNLGYSELVEHSIVMDIGDGISIRVLDLETLIVIKEELGGEKDRGILPILRRSLAEERKRGAH
jgi:hypothetical protein